VSDYLFDLDGGEVCLDFANTRASSAEHLDDYADLVAFAAQSQLLTPEDADWLRAEAVRDRVSAEGVMVRARRLRAAIVSIFSAIASGTKPREHDLEQLNFELAATLQHARILSSHSEHAYVWGWSGRNPDAPLWGISRSAADLLVDDARRRLVRQCGGSDCNWLFLDTTRNRSRQWCSMRSCGNREKARRHYQRRRSASATASTPNAGSES
jgi:predicted RNA-binding Zn ribbon-like protein